LGCLGDDIDDVYIMNPFAGAQAFGVVDGLAGMEFGCIVELMLLARFITKFEKRLPPHKFNFVVKTAINALYGPDSCSRLLSPAKSSMRWLL
jgi:hypothetical protein